MRFWKRNKPGLKSEIALFHDDIYAVSIWVFFIECMINHNYSSLVRSGNPSDEEIMKAWGNLLDKYQTEAQEKNYSEVCELITQIGQSTCKLSMVELCVQVLWYNFEPKYVEKLRELGYRRYKLDPENKEEYYNDLNKILSASKVLRVSINQLQDEKEEILKKQEHKALTMADFTGILVDMGIYCKRQIDPDVTTVGEFVQIKNRMNDYAKAQKKLQYAGN